MEAIANESVSPKLRREILKVYGFPITMFALAIIPGLNFTYSGHWGSSWLVVPISERWYRRPLMCL